MKKVKSNRKNTAAKCAKLLATAAITLGLACGAQADVETDADRITWKYSTYKDYVDGRYVTSAHLGSDAIYDFPVVYKTIGKAVTIPSQLGGCTVRRLYSFNDYNWITELTIPEGVSIVYGIRLAGCRRIEFPESLKSFLFLTSLGENATNVDDPLWNEDDPRPFYGLTNVTEAVLPQVVLDMGHIWKYMTNLERAVIRDNVTEVWGFDNCHRLTEVVFPDSGSVKSIRGYVHTYDGDQPGAFENCTGLSCITIPNSVTNMGFRAFDGCANLMSITIPFVGQCRGGYRKNYKNETIKDSGMEQFASDLSDRIRSITITDDTDPGEYAFANLHVATNITLSANTDNIGKWAFGGCWELPSIVIPDAVTNIGERAFYNCRSLKSVKIGAGVKAIHSTAFSSCTSIVEVCIPQFISGQTMAMAINFPDAYSSLTNVVVSEGATSIGDSAFWGCQRLSAVTVASTVKSIGREAFANCAALDEVTIPEGVETIGDRAFANCTGLKKAFLPLSLYGKVGSSVFEGCSAELEVVYAKIEITAAAEHGGCVTGGGSYNVGTSVTLRAVPDSGYAFSHWTGAASSSQNPLVVTADAAKSYTAVFEPLPIAFTSVKSSTSGVSLSWNGLVWATTYRIYRGNTSAQSSASVLVELPNNGNCTYLDETGVVDRDYWYWVEAEGPSDEVMSEPMTGRREKLVVMSPITYTNLHGAMNPNPDTYQEGTSVTFVNPGGVSGYTFVGWTPAQITTDMTGAKIITAAWTAHRYSIVYNANGGNGTMSATDATYDVELSVAGNEFTRYGYTFTGWATNETGEVIYTAEQIVSNLTAQSGGVIMLYAVWELSEVAPPEIAPVGGSTFSGASQTVSITCATPGATIYYSINGVNPKETATYLYSGPFTITDTATIKAKSVYGSLKSDVVSATITKIDPAPPAAPVIMPGDGATFLGDSCLVTITCATPDAIIYCTTNGSNPKMTETNRYKGPFEITATTTIKAIAKNANDDLKSSVTTATISKVALTYASAMDADGLIFSSGGANGVVWMVATDATADGGVAVKSGEIGDSDNTWIETSVRGNGTFSFKWRADCEDDDTTPTSATWDHIRVETNGIEIARIDGNTSWLGPVSFDIVDGATIRWTFEKDESDEGGNDCVWIDSVSWTPREGIPEVAVDAQPSEVNNAVDSAGFADADVKGVIGGSAAEYNAFKTWAASVKVAAGSPSAATAAGEAAVVANTNAAAAFLMGAERLFENAPKVEIGEVVVGDGGETGGGQGTDQPVEVTVSVTVKDGEAPVSCVAEKVAALFEATSDLDDWTGAAKLTPTVGVEAGEGATMRFKVTPGDGTAPRAFLRIHK